MRLLDGKLRDVQKFAQRHSRPRVFLTQKERECRLFMNMKVRSGFSQKEAQEATDLVKWKVSGDELHWR